VFPVPFQVAGFTLTGLTLLYAVSARYIWYKHFLVALPAHALLDSWTIWRLWGSRAHALSSRSRWLPVSW